MPSFWTLKQIHMAKKSSKRIIKRYMDIPQLEDQAIKDQFYEGVEKLIVILGEKGLGKMKRQKKIDVVRLRMDALMEEAERRGI